MRDSKGRFLKGSDPDRHTFTPEDSRKGYEKLVEKVGGSCGISEAKRRAYLVICKKESVRCNNPSLIRAVTKIRCKHKGQESRKLAIYSKEHRE